MHIYKWKTNYFESVQWLCLSTSLLKAFSKSTEFIHQICERHFLQENSRNFYLSYKLSFFKLLKALKYICDSSHTPNAVEPLEGQKSADFLLFQAIFLSLIFFVFQYLSLCNPCDNPQAIFDDLWGNSGNPQGGLLNSKIFDCLQALLTILLATCFLEYTERFRRVFAGGFSIESVFKEQLLPNHPERFAEPSQSKQEIGDDSKQRVLGVGIK